MLLPIVAEIVTARLADTPVVAMLKVAVVAPAGTVTVAGTVVLVLFDDNVTTSPEGPAGFVRVTVPTADAPPTTEPGATETLETEDSVTESVAVFVVEPFAAEIVALTLEDTLVVLMVNVAVVLPAATVTVAGTVAAELLDVRFTTNPPVGAWPLIVTVPVEVLPPATVDGDSWTALTTSGAMMSVLVFAVPLSVAVMVTVVTDDTDSVVMLNVPELAPAGIKRLDGRVALELLEFSVMTKPPTGA